MSTVMSPAAAILPQLSAALERIVAEAAPSVVSVRSLRARSSGFVWRPGLIVTADEALAEAGEVAVTLASGATRAAHVVGRDPTTDIALLRTGEADLSALGPVAGSTPAAGALAVVVGARDGDAQAALAMVSRSSGAWRSMRGGEIDARLELDAPLRASAEGGIVLDAAGAPFGMAVLGPRRRVLVIPAATIERVAARLAAHGRITRGYLGLGLQPVALDGGGVGAMVMSVDASGPGAAAGLHQGDVLVAWEGEPLGSLRALMQSLGPDSVGRQVRLGVRRSGTMHEAHLTIGERPEA